MSQQDQNQHIQNQIYDMDCGCSKNKKLKTPSMSPIDTTKTLTIESMKDLSIDNIIKLYQDGYTLENTDINNPDINKSDINNPDITTLSPRALPYIEGATAYWDGDLTHLWVLWTNSGSEGYIKLVGRWGGYDYLARSECVPIVVGLARATEITTNILPPDLDVYGYGCDSTGDGCPAAPTCSSLNENHHISAIGIYGIETTPPNAPPGLTITPGDRQLAISWGTPSGVPISAYFIRIKQGATTIVEGYKPAHIHNYVKTDLTNGVTYTVEVRAHNYNMTAGPFSSGTGTPTAAPTCTAIALVANPTSIQQGGTITLTATTTPPSSGFSVQFKVDGNIVGTQATNSSGVATHNLDTSGLSIGQHNVTANVGTQCTSSTVQIQITSVPTGCTNISLSAEPSAVGQGGTITLTATTTPASAGFSVQFKVDGNLVSIQVTNALGIATYNFNTTGLSLGQHNVTANVGTECTSSTVLIQITAPIDPCVSITIEANPASVAQGGLIVLTATVTDPPNTAGYPVDFKIDGSVATTKTTNSSGVATYNLNTSTLAAGAHDIQAVVATQCTSSIGQISVTGAPVGEIGGTALLLGMLGLVALGIFMSGPKTPKI